MSFEETLRQIVREEILAAVEKLQTQQQVADPDLPPVLTVEQAAKAMQIGVNKMYDLTRRKGFPAVRDGWKIRISRDGMFRWFEQEALANSGQASQR